MTAPTKTAHSTTKEAADLSAKRLQHRKQRLKEIVERVNNPALTWTQLRDLAQDEGLVVSYEECRDLLREVYGVSPKMKSLPKPVAPRKDTLPELVLRAAETLPSPFSLTQLVIACWQLCPIKFCLADDGNRIHLNYPSDNKVISLLSGERGLVKRGLLERVGNLYRLNKQLEEKQCSTS